MAILRIQWLKPDGEEYFWREASSHSHYVTMQRFPLETSSDGWWAFCNGELWFRAHDIVNGGIRYLNDHEIRGYVSSYLELTKK